MVVVYAHVDPETDFPAHYYPGEDRVTVDVAKPGGSVTLFLDHTELARFRDTLGEIERELAARATDMNTADPIGESTA
ncbi:hypothetical protein GCM10009613_40550 [Pseudonocardia kongjuensis]|uniref:Uncharacterized protein n=2 Tax=Pseudonocardia kongjuensis TaxID=102227 RepID=A0ABN1Y1K5_9PSEU